MSNVEEIVLTLILVAATILDLKTDRISNRLILIGFATGLVFQCMRHRAVGILYFIIYIILPVLMFYLLFKMRTIGAGDIKLFSIICCYGGIPYFLKTACIAFFIGATVGGIKMLIEKGVGRQMSIFFKHVLQFTTTGIAPDFQSTRLTKIHFSYCILFAVLAEKIMTIYQ